MFQTNLSDRSYETTKLLRRSKGVFSKTRRTLTSPPQFRIGHLSGPEELTTTALFKRHSYNSNIDNNHMGTITPAHNCRCRSSDVGKYLLRDWKSFPLFYKGKSSCKSIFLKKQFPPDSVNHTCPGTQYISDHRPRGLSLQQLNSAKCFFETIGRITLSCFLNGTVGYRTYSEDSKESRVFLLYSTYQCAKQNTKTITVIPDICLERRSTGTTVKKIVPKKTEKPSSLVEFRDDVNECVVRKYA